MEGSCEDGNEPLGSIKDGKFFDYLSILIDSQEELCSMELVIRAPGNTHIRSFFVKIKSDSVYEQ